MQRIGAMIEEVDIQTNTPTQSTSGHKKPSWSSLFVSPAEVKELLTDEDYEADKVSKNVDVRVRMRFDTRAEDTTRSFLWNGNRYLIVGSRRLGSQDGMYIYGQLEHS